MLLHMMPPILASLLDFFTYGAPYYSAVSVFSKEKLNLSYTYCNPRLK